MNDNETTMIEEEPKLIIKDTTRLLRRKRALHKARKRLKYLFMKAKRGDYNLYEKCSKEKLFGIIKSTYIDVRDLCKRAKANTKLTKSYWKDKRVKEMEQSNISEMNDK